MNQSKLIKCPICDGQNFLCEIAREQTSSKTVFICSNCDTKIIFVNLPSKKPEEAHVCATCKYYDKDNIDITCQFCGGEYKDRWEKKE